jgi:hypothetical protein
VARSVRRDPGAPGAAELRRACSLQRPFDDRSQPRINVEAEAVLTIMRLVESGSLELLSSEALDFEIGRIPQAQRQTNARLLLKLASRILELTDEIEALAADFVKRGSVSVEISPAINGSCS